MSQPALNVDVQLPGGWQLAEEPPPGASVQAFAPADGGFRSSLTINVYVHEGGGEQPPLDEIHAAHVEDLLGALPDGKELGTTNTALDGLDGRTSAITFEQGGFTVVARMWTLQVSNAVLGVVGLYDQQKSPQMSGLFTDIISSLHIARG